jgi:hypothetical protein
MAYGEPIKLNQAIGAIQKTVQMLNRDARFGIFTFDATPEVLLDLDRSNREKIGTTLGKIKPRGVTCIAAGLVEAVNLLEKGGVLLLTDGRANLSLNRMGGFEGSLALEEEFLKIGEEAKGRGIAVHTIAVGEDAFTYGLSVLATKTGGQHWLAEDFKGLDTETLNAPRALHAIELSVHGVPAELPSAQPTWTNESQMLHVAVVSEGIYETYKAHRRAFLINRAKGREARTALISIESEVLSEYRERRAKTTNEVRNGETILLDRSYRDYLALDENSSVKLSIY